MKKLPENKIRIIRSDDPRFDIFDGANILPRAGFEINQNCPAEYKVVLQECINNGWLKPVAYMAERELLFMGLTNV